MKKAELLAKLNWFYSLEKNQVDLYLTQSRSTADRYVSTGFERIAAIEEGHVRNISCLIKELGGTPTWLGDVIAPLTGSLAGFAVSLSGLENTLKANILLENKAMEDYRNLIKAVKENNIYGPHLLTVLEHNLIDEDLHTAWFTARIELLH